MPVNTNFTNGQVLTAQQLNEQFGAAAAQTDLAQIQNGTATDAGALTGAETVPASRGAGLIQTTLATLSTFVLSIFKIVIGTAGGLVARTIVAELLDLPTSVKRFGAKGDVVQLTDGAMTSGSANFSSASATFSAADVGKAITVTGAGTSGAALTTTIASVASETAITLATAAGTTVSSAAFMYGTDDTVAIQTACTYTTATGRGEVYFPPGTYLYNSTTFSDVSNGVTVRGANRTSSVILTNNPQANIFYVWQYGSAIKNLGFASAVSNTGGCYIQLTGGENVIEDCAISGDYLGINLTGVAAKIRNIVFSSGAAGAVRINLNCGDASPVISDVIMMGQSAPYPAAGIQCQHVTALTLANISALNQGNALNIVPGNGQSVNNLQGINCFLDNGLSGLTVNPSGNGSVSRVNLVNSWTGDSSGNGVDIKNNGTGIVKGITLINHQSPICGGSGIATAGACTDINVIGGLYAGCASDGLYFGHAGAVRVIGAECGAYQAIAGNGAYGAVFAGGLTDIICKGVGALGNVTGGILDQTDNSVTKFISDSIEPGFAKAGPITVTASPFTYAAPFDQSVYVSNGTVSSVAVGATTLFETTNVSVNLKRGESVVVTYTGAINMNYTA